MNIRVNHPFFDEMRFKLNSSSVDTGERSMGGAGGAWHLSSTNFRLGGGGANDYYEYVNMGNEIKEALTQARQEVRDEVAAANAPKTAVVCPLCGATTIPDAQGCCEYCGGAIRG